MIDALFPEGITDALTPDITAAYIDHPDNPQSYAQMCAKYPHAIHLKISVNGTVGADILDVEQGTRANTAAEALSWVVDSRRSGVNPTVYCNELSTGPIGWAALKAYFDAHGVRWPHWWTANYDGDPTLPAGADAKQYTDRDSHNNNTYDTSSTAPGWPVEEDIVTPQDIAAIAQAVLNAPVGKDTGTLAQTVHDARQISRRVEIEMLARFAAIESALSQQASGQPIDYSKVQAAAKAGADEALSSVTLTVNTPAS